MNLEQKIKTTKFILELNRLEDSLKNPALIALFNEGWEVFSYIPVEDNGPKVILLLKQNVNKIEVEKLSIVKILNTLFLFLIFITLLSNTLS